MLKYKIATAAAETDILTQYGVHVSSTTGLIGRPDFKTTQKYDWKDLNGEWIDLGARRYKSREIKMRCWIKASREETAVANMNTFIKALSVNQIMRLHIEFINTAGQVVTGEKGLYYLVYLSKTGQPAYKWNPNRQMITFDITLTEPSPLKRIYSVNCTDTGTLTIAYTSASEFDVHWGDGHVDYDIIGQDTIRHEYTATGTYIVIVTGVIGDISAMTLTADHEFTITQLYEEI